MDTELQKVFRGDINNFSKRNHVIKSDPFSIDGCEWYLEVYPKGNSCDYLSVYLAVFNHKSLQPGWKWRATYLFVLLNESDKELYRTSETCNLFCAEAPGWGMSKTLPLSKFQEEGVLENDKLTIEVFIKVKSMSWNFVKHQDIAAVDFISKKKLVETTYINIIFGLMETLRKPPQSLSETELSKANRELTKLMEVGFSLDWVKSKLEEVSLVRKKAVSDGSQVQNLEKRVKDVELTLSHLKVELDKEKIKYAAATRVSSFEFIDCFIRRFFLSCFSVSKQ